MFLKQWKLKAALCGLLITLMGVIPAQASSPMLFWEGAGKMAISSGKAPYVTLWKNGPRVTNLRFCIKGQGCGQAHGIGNLFWRARVRAVTKPGKAYWWEARYSYQGHDQVDWGRAVAGRVMPKTPPQPEM